MRKDRLKTLLKLIGVELILTFFSLVIFTTLLTKGMHWKDPLTFPRASLEQVWIEMGISLTTNQRLFLIYGTVFLAFKGFVVGLLLSVVLGTPAGIFPGIANKSMIIINSFRSLPLTLLLPFLFLMPAIWPSGPPGLHASLPNKELAWLVGLGVSLYVVIAWTEGITQRNKTREMVYKKLYGYGRARYLFYVLSIEMLPSVLTGIRIAALFALVLTVVLEQLVEYPGMGNQIWKWFNETGESIPEHPEANAIAMLVCLAIIGIVVDSSIRVLRHYLLFWARQKDDE